MSNTVRTKGIGRRILCERCRRVLGFRFMDPWCTTFALGIKVRKVKRGDWVAYCSARCRAKHEGTQTAAGACAPTTTSAPESDP